MALALVLCGAGMASAAVVRMSGTGTISLVGSDFASLGFADGQSASFSLIYDTDTLPTALSGSTATYIDAIISTEMVFNGTATSALTPANLVQVTDEDTFDPVFPNSDSFLYQENLAKIFSGVSDLRAQVFLRGGISLFSSTGLPGVSPDLSVVTDGRFRLVDSSGVAKNLTATITSLTIAPVAPIPLPAGLPLLAGAVGLMALLRRRRRAAA